MGANSFSQSYKSVTLLLGIRNNINHERILERPILKLVMILEPNDIDSPTKGAWYDIKMMNLLRWEVVKIT